MKTVGLDTSIVIRLLTGVPEDQAERAKEYLQELHADKTSAIVSDLVVAEAYFTLTYHYKVPKSEAAAKLKELLESGYVFPDPKGAAMETLKANARTKSGFIDQLIRNQYLSQAEEVATFDSDFGRMERVFRLKI